MYAQHRAHIRPLDAGLCDLLAPHWLPSTIQTNGVGVTVADHHSLNSVLLLWWHGFTHTQTCHISDYTPKPETSRFKLKAHRPKSGPQCHFMWPTRAGRFRICINYVLDGLNAMAKYEYGRQETDNFTFLTSMLIKYTVSVNDIFISTTNLFISG